MMFSRSHCVTTAQRYTFLSTTLQMIKTDCFKLPFLSLRNTHKDFFKVSRGGQKKFISLSPPPYPCSVMKVKYRVNRDGEIIFLVIKDRKMLFLESNLDDFTTFLHSGKTFFCPLIELDQNVNL